MDGTHIVDWLVGIVLSVLGFFLRKLHGDITKNTDAIVAVNQRVSDNFVHKVDYKDDLRDVKEMLNRIFERLDSKVDKGHP